MFNWKQYKQQHVQVVDMCAATIFAHRQKMLPLRAIHLLPRMYEQFRAWAEKHLGRELAEGEGIEFDSVHIERGSASQSTPLVIELYT
jgi:hypothetical protein